MNVARRAFYSTARTWRRPVGTAALAAALALSGVACSSPQDPGPTCVKNLDLSCAPLYPPDFDHVYNNTLHPTCAQAGGSCHSAEGHQHGLVFEDPDQSYALLLGTADGRVRVVPGDPACSLLVERIMSTGRYAMPPGNPLSDAERCAIVQWVANGAQR